jgi:hypothetical protein
MSHTHTDFNIFDPTGVMKSMRDAQMDAWAKAMVELVNSEAYAQANGAMLQAWLTSSGPYLKAMESAMKQTLANLNVPSRDEMTRLAERLTNVEMQLDSLDAKLDECLSFLRKSARSQKARSHNEETKA